VSLSGYHATWHPTEQIPEDSIGTSACADQYCDLESTALGKTWRWIVTGNLIADDWRATAYAQYYDWRMSSNPTYDYQIDQFDRRWTVGGRYERTLIKSDKFNVDVGTELRYDDITNVGVDHTDGGVFVGNISDNAVKESSVAVYSEATWKPIQDLRLMGGLRGDLYNFDVSALSDSPDNAQGNKSDHQFSPKLGAAYTLNKYVELYGNWGQGFHSNDGRGVLNKQTPINGLATGTGYETGARFEVGTFKVSVAYWWLNLSSELIFVGDSNSVEPRGSSQRRGYEITAFWRPIDWLGIDAVYTGSHARYGSVQDDPDYDPTDPNALGRQGRYIEGSIESAGELGFSAVKGKWEFSGRLRYLGPYPMVPSNRIRAHEDKAVNFRAAYKTGHYTIYAELLNALGDDGKDVSYYYASYIPGRPDLTATRGVDEYNTVMSRAEEPRTLRWGVKYEF